VGVVTAAPPGLDAVVDVNVKGVLYTTRVVLPYMLKQGRGVVINVSSGAGFTGFPEIVTYCASKFAVVGFTEALAQELRGTGVQVYGLCPGRVATDMQVQYSGERIGMAPERVAETILKLAGRRPPVASGRSMPLPGRGLAGLSGLTALHSLLPMAGQEQELLVTVKLKAPALRRGEADDGRLARLHILPASSSARRGIID
jgi:hypothetical protein